MVQTLRSNWHLKCFNFFLQNLQPVGEFYCSYWSYILIWNIHLEPTPRNQIEGVSDSHYFIEFLPSHRMDQETTLCIVVFEATSLCKHTAGTIVRAPVYTATRSPHSVGGSVARMDLDKIE